MSTFVILQNRVMDATLRGGSLAGGNRDQIKEDINEAIKQVDLQLRPAVAKSVEILVANQQDYSILTDFGISAITGFRDVTYHSVNGPQDYSLEEVDPMDIREWRQTNPASTWVNFYAIDGLDLFMVFPATQAIGDTITITYVPRQADLVADGDIPLYLPPEWHEIYELAAIQRSMRQTNPDIAANYTQMYEHKLDEYRKWKNRRGGARSKVARAGRYGRRLIAHDNSADWRY